MLSCLCQQNFTGDIPFFCKKIKNRLVDSVIMSFCIRAVYWITVHLFTKAKLLFRRDQKHPSQIPSPPQQIICFFGYRSGNGTRCQIKNLICKPFPDRFYRRKHCGNGFPGPGRRLNKQILLPANGAVHPCDKISLSLPVRKWKPKPRNRLISFLSCLILELRPLLISGNQRQKPVLNLCKRILLTKPANFFGIQITIRHLNRNLRTLLLQRQDISITFCLCQVRL